LILIELVLASKPRQTSTCENENEFDDEDGF
jgi:hypothetical protein